MSSSSRKTAGQRARTLAKASGRRHLSAVLPLISQAVEAAASKGLFRTDVLLPEGDRWFLDATNQRDLRKALRREDLDSGVPVEHEGRVLIPITWGDYPLSHSSAFSALPAPVSLSRTVILVVNASGNVGRATLRALAAHSDLFEIRATTRKPSRELSEAFPQVHWLYADLNEPRSVAEAVRGVTKVFYIGAPGFDRNVHARNVARAAADHGVAHIVDLSTVNCTERSMALSNINRDQEEIFEGSPVPWTHLRVVWFLDNIVSTNAATIKATNRLFLPFGDARVSAVSTIDIGQAAALVLTRAGADGLFVDLTGPESLSGAEMAAILSEELARPIEYVSLSDEEFRIRMASFHMPQPLIDALSELYTHLARGWGAAVAADGGQLLKSQTTFRQVVRQNKKAF